MDRGRVLALDTPQALKATVGADTIARVTTTGDVAAMAQLLQNMEGVTRAEVIDGVVNVFFRGFTGAIPKVVTAAEAAGLPVTDISVTEPTLETVFIALTGKDLRD